MSDNPFLVARTVVKEYLQGTTRLRVLRGLSLHIEEGQFLVVAGASGAGKSTLLHILGLLDTPTSGEVFFEGKNLSALSSYQQSRHRNTLFGFVFQFFHLLPDFSALENVMLPAMIGNGLFHWRQRKRDLQIQASQLLETVGLKDRLAHRPSQLSGGERQRVALCRALINKPRVLLLDEPTGNLDSKTGRQIHDLICDLHRSFGQTIIMVTHDEHMTDRADKILHIQDGEIVS